MTDSFPRIAVPEDRRRIQGAPAALEHRARLRRRPAAAGRDAARAAVRAGRRARRQSLLRAADGRLGRHARRPAIGAHHPALAQLRPGRREAVLGRRSRGGAARRPRQPEPAAADRGEPPGDCRPARHADRGPPREVRQQRRRRRVSRAAADAFRPLVAAERLRSSRAARRGAAIPCSIAASRPACRCCPTTIWIGWSRISSPPRGWRRRPATSSSTSRRATATSGTSCSAPARGEGRYGGPSLENRMRFMRNVIEAVRAAVPGLLIAVRVSIFDLVPYRKREDGIGEPDPDAAAVNHGFGLTHGDRASIDDGVELLSALEQMNVQVDLHHRRQPVLQPAHAAAGAVSAARRLPAARGSAARRRPARRRDGAAEAALPEPGDGGIGLQLPAGVAAERGAARGAERPHRLRRPRPHRPVVPGPAGRRSQRHASCAGSPSAARSATARPDRGWAWCRAAIRSTRSTWPSQRRRSF